MNRFSTCAWIDTSSAATASSQTRNRACTASARAMPMRARWPPENWCGKRRMSVGSSPTRSACCADVVDLLRACRSAVHDRRLADDVDDAHARIERGERILEDHLRSRAALARAALGVERRDVRARARSARPRVGGSMPTTMRPSVDLPQPDSPTSPTTSPCRDREIDAVDRVHDLVARDRRRARLRDARRARSSGFDEALGDARAARAAAAASRSFDRCVDRASFGGAADGSSAASAPVETAASVRRRAAGSSTVARAARRGTRSPPADSAATASCPGSARSGRPRALRPAPSRAGRACTDGSGALEHLGRRCPARRSGPRTSRRPSASPAMTDRSCVIQISAVPFSRQSFCIS